MPTLTRLSATRLDFPDANSALTDPNGLVAVGGDLTPGRILAAYAAGIFPWFDDDEGPILWWSPEPRAVLRPQSIRISRSLRKRLRQGTYRVTADRVFGQVIEACAAPRADRDDRASGTWITPNMQAAYRALHELGFAHSIECWQADRLVGGLYGLSLGRFFFGESMFAAATDASKFALVRLARQLEDWDFELIDCQVMNPHLESLGAQAMPRRAFLDLLRHNSGAPTRRGPWSLDDEG